jgi:hypothetical protein
MYIVVYTELKEDAMRTFAQVRDEILKDFKDIMSCPHPGVIDLASRLIRIDFRCGDPHRMSGLCCNYFYNVDGDSEIELLLQYSADRVNGRKLDKLEDIRKVVIDFLA